jgi:hypothetical protein
MLPTSGPREQMDIRLGYCGAASVPQSPSIIRRMSEPTAGLSTIRDRVGLCRTLTAIVITSVVTMPIWTALFGSVLVVAYPADAERFGLRFIADAALQSLIYGWILALPPVGIHALAVTYLARWRLDSPRTSIAVGIGIGLLAATCLVLYIMHVDEGGSRLMKTDPAFPWVLASLPLIFGLTGALMASLHWFIAIYPRRRLRLASRDGEAIRAME